MQHVDPAAHEFPPTLVNSGCGLLNESAMHVDVLQHSDTQSAYDADAGSGNERISPPSRSVSGASGVAVQLCPFTMTLHVEINASAAAMPLRCI